MCQQGEQEQHKHTANPDQEVDVILVELISFLSMSSRYILSRRLPLSDTLPASMTKAFRLFTRVPACDSAELSRTRQRANPATNAAPMHGMMSAQQASQADQQNFPPLLLQQLSAIKAASLNDDYAYRQLAHLTENIGPRPTGSVQASAAAAIRSRRTSPSRTRCPPRTRHRPALGPRSRNRRAHRVSRHGARHNTKNCSHRFGWKLLDSRRRPDRRRSHASTLSKNSRPSAATKLRARSSSSTKSSTSKKPPPD